MKKLMIFVMLVVAMSINAQVQIYRAGFAETTITNDWDDAEYIDLTNQGVLVVFDLTKMTAKITNGFADQFIIRNISEPSLNEQDGHTRTTYFMDCIDKDGEECIVMYSYFADQYMFVEKYYYRIRVIYNDFWYGYYCNPAMMPDAPKTTPKKAPDTKTPTTLSI